MDDLRDRTKKFALRIIRLFNALPETRPAMVIGNQLLRAGTAVGANYRAACRARSPKEFAARLGVVEEEADESAYWMELLIDSQLMEEARVKDLCNEAEQLVAIAVASIKTVRRRM